MQECCVLLFTRWPLPADPRRRPWADPQTDKSIRKASKFFTAKESAAEDILKEAWQ